MTLCVPVFWLKRFQIFGFRGNIYLPAPSPLPKARYPLFPPSFPSWNLHSLLVAPPPPCRRPSFMLLGLAYPGRWSTPDPHPPPPSTSHMPRLPARAWHLPPKSPTPPPNKRRPKPWCMRYSQDLKEHLAAEKQIAAWRIEHHICIIEPNS